MSNFNLNSQEVVFDAEDIAKNKTMAGLAYILFFLPLFACPDSAYGRFHANQSLVLLLVSVAGNIVLSFIPFIGGILVPIFGLLIFVLFVLGLINGFSGRGQTLPLIGQITILK